MCAALEGPRRHQEEQEGSCLLPCLQSINLSYNGLDAQVPTYLLPYLPTYLPTLRAYPSCLPTVDAYHLPLPTGVWVGTSWG